ncbi:hypothetical protein [Seonamhaeicola sp.]|uniref:hypothetical protein n=1 Tax=Seonamhaeicola sp. TaxID=1912245 RepID=UPI00261C662F|nr:hypothetical protein [Seonamhaeicola sp.]
MKTPDKLQLDFGFDIKPMDKLNPKTITKKKAQKNFVFEFMDCLSSPVIVYESPWKDDIPKDLLGKITMSRLLCLMKNEEMASITEVVAYMMPRTFEAPMHSEWVNIYTWCGLQYANMFNNSEKREDMVTAMQEIAPTELSSYEQGLLKGLRIWIYNQRRKALKVRLKNDRNKEIKLERNAQGSLFDN